MTAAEERLGEDSTQMKCAYARATDQAEGEAAQRPRRALEVRERVLEKTAAEVRTVMPGVP